MFTFVHQCMYSHRFLTLISDVVRPLLLVLSPSYFLTMPRPSNTLRTRRTISDTKLLFSSLSTQFFSAENFSSFLENSDFLDSTGEPVREISDQELTRLGFPIPTEPPDRVVTQRPISHQDFPIVDSPFFQIISRKYQN